MTTFRTLALLSLASSSAAALAADLGTAQGFNAFIFGSASLNGGHADGAIAVGGSVTGTNYTTMLSNLPATVGADSHVGFYTGGSATFTDKLTVNNAGNARVGGTYAGGNGSSLNGGTLYQGSAANVSTSLFTTQQSYSQTQSSYLLSLTSTSINTTDPNNWSVDASAAQAYGSARIVSVPASTLSGTRTLNVLNLGSALTLIINVTGTGDVSNFGVTLNGADDRVLWNYGGAGNFNVTGRALEGSLLAPYAAVTTSQNIDGTLIANSWTNLNSVEIHAGAGKTFDGFIPQAVPEPGTWAVLGLGAFAVLRKRRR